ncbi:DMT family transporter [Hymenobacter terrenus]|uniref:DMT family transporter n=1 Tax=Hymenobacter terrenus TaxID=1629124 RepID=UPI000619B779|nr:DMT family transporter [Hymenobacter terrenus]
MTRKPEAWILYSVAAAFFWGTWGVVAKFISADVNPFTNHLLFSGGMLLTLPLVLGRVKKQKPNRKGLLWGLVAGVLAVTGNVAVYKAFSTGGLAAIVIPVTNLYPLVTIVIALLVFKEKLNWINGIGILLAVPAVIMLSGESLLFENPMAFFQSIGPNSWLLYSMVALVFWGVFSAAQKETTNYISAEWSYVSFIVSSGLVALVFAGLGWTSLALPTQTLGLGLLAGMLNGLGVLASFAAYSAEGKASKVTTIAGALQPVFTIVLALVFLSESFSLLESLGILLAIVGALTLSYERQSAL